MDIVNKNKAINSRIMSNHPRRQKENEAKKEKGEILQT